MSADPQSFWKRLTDEQLQGAEYTLRLVELYLRAEVGSPEELVGQLLGEVAESRQGRPALRGEVVSVFIGDEQRARRRAP